jgi:hypothetical protein
MVGYNGEHRLLTQNNDLGEKMYDTYRDEYFGLPPFFENEDVLLSS